VFAGFTSQRIKNAIQACIELVEFAAEGASQFRQAQSIEFRRGEGPTGQWTDKSFRLDRDGLR
jgi:hypothetical protein